MIEGFETILAAVITALATLTSVFVGQRFINRKQKDCVIRETSQNANVYTALSFVMGEMGADRCYILEFHNGEVYFSGRGQQKFSCTHEITEEGISPECDFSQNHRISNYHRYINELVSEDRFVYADINNINDKAFHKMLSQKGVESIYNVPIKTLDNKIIGILGVDYVKDRMNFAKHDEDKFVFMRRQARIISGYLI